MTSTGSPAAGAGSGSASGAGDPDPGRDGREWVSFDDPEEDRTWVFDVTFLESNWSCIYGRGCLGVLTGPAAEFEQGCCSYGAHFTGDEDVARVEAAARRLRDDQWQHRRQSPRRAGPIRRARGEPSVTRIVDEACIFLNRPGFPGGAGCALHRAALEQGERPLDWKPDVCWQLPLRREDSVGESGRVTTTVREWDRRDWGLGGQEFHWWCTESPDAYVGARPVFEGMRDEIEQIAGPAVYGWLASYMLARRGGALRVRHPALRARGVQGAPVSSSSSSRSSDS